MSKQEFLKVQELSSFLLNMDIFLDEDLQLNLPRQSVEYLDKKIIYYLSPEFRKYYLNKDESCPISLLNKINEVLKIVHTSLPMIIFTRIYMAFCKGRLNNDSKMIRSNQELITNLKKENQKINDDMEKIKDLYLKSIVSLDKKRKKINNAKEEIKNYLIKIKKIEEEKTNISVLTKIENEKKELEKQLISYQDIINELKIKEEKLQLDLDGYKLLELEQELEMEEFFSDYYKGLEENDNFVLSLKDEIKNFFEKINQKKKKIKDLKEKLQEKDLKIKKVEEFLDKNFINQIYIKIVMKNKKKEKMIKYLKENYELKEKMPRFFNFSLTPFFLSKVCNWLDIELEEFDHFLYYNPKTTTNKKIKKFFLYVLEKISKKTGTKVCIWYRNFLTKDNDKEKKDINTKFYYTYVNPLNDPSQIKLEEFKLLSSLEKRHYFVNAYNTFSVETKNTINLYEKEINEKKIIKREEELERKVQEIKDKIIEKIRKDDEKRLNKIKEIRERYQN